MKEELNQFVETAIKVGPDGHVRLVDVMGDDSSVVQAARVSYGAGTKTVREDRGLIRYLLRHSHTTPFEMCVIKLHVRVPMDIWRQWIRHRTASVNEYSTRYSEAIDSMAVTPPGEWRKQSKKNKQGSGEMVDSLPDSWGPAPYTPQEYLSSQEEILHDHIRRVYKSRLEFGVAREQARKDLPLSNYTEAYWQINLHNLLHFLALRMDSHAQKEIQDFANAIAQIVEKWVPISWEAFNDYHFRRKGMTFSAHELQALNFLLELAHEQCAGSLSKKEFLLEGVQGLEMTNREVNEFFAKFGV